ncbi:unnamed protein product [Symbiodinium sp. CCMP2592]|nr:unnamed protein product [Symbiodinium sp. CCMP2592]
MHGDSPPMLGQSGNGKWLESFHEGRPEELPCDHGVDVAMQSGYTARQTPSDIMKRGPLFDPDSDGRSPLISEMSSSSFLGSSGCRAWPIQGPTMSRSTARVSDHSSRRPVPLWTDLKAATEPARAAKPSGSWALAEASTRESEAFSVATSISFGREDPRVCDASMPAAAATQPVASRVSSSAKSTLPGVARQLDFEGVGGVFAEPDHSPLSSVDAWHSRTSSLSSLDELRELSLLSFSSPNSREFRHESTQTETAFADKSHETCNTKPASCEVQSVRPASATGEMPDEALRGFLLHVCTCCKHWKRSPTAVQNRPGWKGRSSLNSLVEERLPSTTKSLRSRRSQSNSRQQRISPETFTLEELQAASRFAQYRCDEHRRSLQLGGRTGRW